MPVVHPSKSEAPEVEDGVYTVRCLSVEPKTIENDKFGKNEKFEIKLRLEGTDDGDGNEIVLNPLLNQAWSEKATLYKWAVAFGCEVDPDWDFDTDELKGKRAQADIFTPEAGGWPRVRAMVRLPKSAGAKAPTKPQDASLPLDEAAAEVAADRAAIAAFWEEAEPLAARGDIADMADRLFQKSVSQLTQAQRDELLVELKRGT